MVATISAFSVAVSGTQVVDVGRIFQVPNTKGPARPTIASEVAIFHCRIAYYMRLLNFLSLVQGPTPNLAAPPLARFSIGLNCRRNLELLNDIRGIVLDDQGRSKFEYLSSNALLSALVALDSRPWADWEARGTRCAYRLLDMKRRLD
jgi:hypothetical protein